jgi:hypothetical protein
VASLREAANRPRHGIKTAHDAHVDSGRESLLFRGGDVMRSHLKARAAACVAVCVFVCVAGAAIAATAANAAGDDPFRAAEAWAFPVFPPPPDPHAPKPKSDPRKVLHVTGSAVNYTQAQMDGIDDADWFPQDHPPAPHIVEGVASRPDLAPSAT